MSQLFSSFATMTAEPALISVTRRPKVSYAGRNGFAERPTEPEEINDSNLYEALNQHRRALYVINHKSSPIPTYVALQYSCKKKFRNIVNNSLEEMKAEINKPDDDVGRIGERIKTLREDHLRDLERLYSFHAQDYKQEVMDRYLSQEEGQGGESDGRNLTRAEIRFQVGERSSLFIHFYFSNYLLPGNLQRWTERSSNGDGMAR